LQAVAAACTLCGCSTDETPIEPELYPASIHAEVLTVDTHVDIPLDFATTGPDPLDGDLQVNLRKMVSGGLDAAFFIVYVGQTQRTDANYAQARTDAMTKFGAIHRMAEDLYPDRIEIAYAAADVERIAAAGKLVAAIGIENGYVIGRDLQLLDDYHALGARYLTLVHNGDNDIATSATARPELGDDADRESAGVTAFGAEVIARLNRLGIMVDVSHASKRSALDAMRLSQAPVIASHSSVRTIADHRRNLDDETLLALRQNGGVVQVVAYESFLKVQPEDTPGPPANVQDLVDHIDYAARLIGIDHVGISSDFGGGGGIAGWADAGETPNVTRELQARGYGEADIAKLWGGNLLRVWRDVERVSAELSLSN
jgi:membrane dipeptidase